MRIASTQRGELLVVAVSDGAGSAPRGGEGAALVCEELSSLIAADAQDLTVEGVVSTIATVIGQVRTSLIGSAAAEQLQPREFACTLLLAVLAPAWSAFAQVGDGAIVTPEDETDQWNWLFWPQRGEYANTTSFITDENALDRVETALIPHATHEIAMFTDGIQHLVLHYETQTVHSPFFERILAAVRAEGPVGPDAVLSDGLASYLVSPTVAEKADDDLTLVLASRKSRVR